jgi:hypothetical protein
VVGESAYILFLVRRSLEDRARRSHCHAWFPRIAVQQWRGWFQLFSSARPIAIKNQSLQAFLGVRQGLFLFDFEQTVCQLVPTCQRPLSRLEDGYYSAGHNSPLLKQSWPRGEQFTCQLPSWLPSWKRTWNHQIKLVALGGSCWIYFGCWCLVGSRAPQWCWGLKYVGLALPKNAPCPNASLKAWRTLDFKGQGHSSHSLSARPQDV